MNWLFCPVLCLALSEARHCQNHPDVCRELDRDSLPEGAIARCRGRGDRVVLAEILPSRLVIAIDAMNVVRLWKLATGEPVGRYSLDAKTAWSARASPKGDVLAFCSHSGVHLRDVRSGRPVGEWLGPVSEIAFSPNGAYLAVCERIGGVNSTACRVRLLRGSSAQVVRTLEGEHRGEADEDRLVFSRDGRFLAAGGAGTISVWSVPNGRLVETHKRVDSFLSPLFFASNGDLVVKETATSRTVRLLDRKKTTTCAVLPVALWDCWACSPDGSMTIVPCYGRDTVSTVIRDWPTFKVRANLNSKAILAAGFSQDGRYCVTADGEGNVLVWAVPEKQESLHWHELSLPRLNAHWATLGGEEPDTALDAFATTPSSSLHFLRRHVRPVPAYDAVELIRDLASDTFAVRQMAMRRLQELEFAAYEPLKAALATCTSLEATRRIRRLLSTYVDGLESWRRGWYAVSILEQIGDGEALRMLADLANGNPAARLTTEAKAALYRFSQDPRLKSIQRRSDPLRLGVD